MLSLALMIASALTTSARAGDDPEAALPQEVLAIEGAASAPAGKGDEELKDLVAHFEAVVGAYKDVSLGITCAPACQSFAKAYNQFIGSVKKESKAQGGGDLGKKIAAYAAHAADLKDKTQAQIPWCLRPHQGLVESQLKALLQDAQLMRNLDRMPCKAWYDVAVLRRDGEKFITRYGKGGWGKNIKTGLFGDETVQCKQRSRLFALDETAQDPFTSKDSGLPYEDFERKVNRQRQSETWALEERTIRADEYSIDFGPIKLYNQSHTVPVYTYKGPFRKDADTRWPKFIVDTWEPSGDYIMSSEERWKKRFPSKSGH